MAPRGRNNWIEALRVIAAFGIVWFHADIPGRRIAYSGLALFLALSTYLECQRDPDRPLELGKLASRLLTPWAAFYAFYVVLDLVRHRDWVQGNPLSWVLEGPSPHLWFLPYAFAWQLMIRGARSKISFRQFGSVVAPIVFCVLMVSMMLSPAWARAPSLQAQPIQQYLGAIGPTAFGVVLAGAERRLSARLVLAAGLALMAFCSLTAAGPAWLPATLGCAALTAAVMVDRKFGLPSLAPLPGLMLGVYLIHPAVMMGVHAAHVAGWPVPVLTFAVSTAMVWAADRVRVTRPRGDGVRAGAAP
jgi:hypothetical protein